MLSAVVFFIKPGFEVIKLFSCSTQLSMTFEMLTSIKISRNSAFSGSDKPRMLFPLLINVKMPAIVSILTFMSRKISCSSELSMKKFYNLGARFLSIKDKPL